MKKKIIAIGFVVVAAVLAPACGSGSSQPTTTVVVNRLATRLACSKADASSVSAQGMADAISELTDSNVPVLIDAANEIKKATTLSAQIAILQDKPQQWCAENEALYS